MALEIVDEQAARCAEAGQRRDGLASATMQQQRAAT